VTGIQAALEFYFSVFYILEDKFILCTVYIHPEVNASSVFFMFMKNAVNKLNDFFSQISSLFKILEM
jgi:hypothetical protein